MSIGNRNRKSAIPAILGQATIAEILRKKRRISKLVLRGQPTDLLINHRRPYKRCDDSRIKGLKSSKNISKAFSARL